MWEKLKANSYTKGKYLTSLTIKCKLKQSDHLPSTRPNVFIFVSVGEDEKKMALSWWKCKSVKILLEDDLALSNKLKINILGRERELDRTNNWRKK